MRSDILYRPAYALAVVQLGQGDSIVTEAGALVSLSESIDLQTSARGGLFKGLTRSLLGGESFFMNTFRAERGAGEITLAPALPGDIVQQTLQGDLYLQSGSFLAGDAGVDIDTKWGGARSFFAGEGLFLIKASGSGDLLMSTYGAIHEKQLAAGERYIIDTGHIVAFDAGLNYSIRRVGGLKSTLFGGEGVVAEFTGPGRVMLQSRSPDRFVDWLAPHLPKQSG